MEVSNLPKTSGIYVIENLYTHKSYVGSSNNLQNRLYKHRALLRHNKHENAHLQNSWNRYGEEVFSCSILLFCSKEDLLRKEQFYLDLLKPEYNIITQVQPLFLTKESIEKMSINLKEGYRTGRIVSASEKEVYQYTLTGEFISSFSSIEKAAKYLGGNRSTIDRAIHGEKGKNIRTGLGFQWRLSKYENIPPIELYPNSGLPKRVGRKYRINFRVTSIKSNVVLIINGSKELGRYFGVAYSCLSYPIKNKTLFRKEFYIVPVKQEELLGSPTKDYQQPS